MLENQHGLSFDVLDDFPSLIEISTQLVGIDFRSRIGGVLSQSHSGSETRLTFAGSVLPSLSKIPARSFALRPQ